MWQTVIDHILLKYVWQTAAVVQWYSIHRACGRSGFEPWSRHTYSSIASFGSSTDKRYATSSSATGLEDNLENKCPLSQSLKLMNTYCPIAMSAEYRSKVAVLHRHWWRFPVNEHSWVGQNKNTKKSNALNDSQVERPSQVSLTRWVKDCSSEFFVFSLF